MRKRINTKGFTLMELLAAVAILGIIGTIGIVSVSKIIDSTHRKFDRTQYESFLQAAELYFSDNKSRLPLTPMEWKEITLQELINAKYIEKLLDSNKNEFDYSKSKVVVTRLTSGKYQYEAVLYRKKGSPIGSISKKVTNQNSNITFKLRDATKYYKESTTYYTKDYPVVDITISDTDQMSGYQYIIYKNGKQFKKSENIEVSGGETVKDAVTLGKEFPFGKYSIKVVAYDKSGNKTTKSTTDNNGSGGGSGTGGGGGDGPFTIYIDRVKPNCAISIDGIVGDNGWYKAKDISLTLKESDKESGILKHDFQTSKDFPNLNTLSTIKTLIEKQSDTGSTTWYGHVEDKAGNVCETEVTVKVDTKSPTCDVISNTSTEKINTTEWYNKYSYYKIEQLKLEQKDEGPSGINRHILAMNTSNLSTTYKNHNDNDYIITEEGEHNYNGYVRDNAGNDVNCSTFIRKDTIDPECPSIFFAEYESIDIPGVFMSPNITFNWLGFSSDTWYAEAYVQEVGQPLPFNYGVYFGQAIYMIAGRLGFTGTYTTELVAYDQAKNDKHCYSGATEPAKEPEPISCKILDGKYYDKNGKEVSEDTYKADCGFASCQIIDGKYYEKNGQQVSETEYNVSCGIVSCQIIDGKYYEKNGQQVSEAEYNVSCDIDEPNQNPFKCINIRNHYYDKDGNSVTEEEYMTSCNIKPDLKCPKISSGDAEAGEWTNKTVTLSFSNLGSGVKSYEWWTSDDDGNYTKKSDNNDPNSATSKTLSAEGSRKGKLVLIGADGTKQECKTSTYKIDKTPPKCGNVSYSPKANTGCTLGLNKDGLEWYKASGAVTVSVGCSDDTSGCKTPKEDRKTVIHTSSDDWKNQEIIINQNIELSDKAGNKVLCPVKLALDRKAPQIEWYRKKSSASISCASSPQKYPYIVYPIITDRGSGYKPGGGYFDWLGGQNHNAGPASPANERRECIGSSTNYSDQKIEWRVTDCVGNSNPSSGTSTKKNLNAAMAKDF